MKCPSCNCHFEGKRCPNCGAKPVHFPKPQKQPASNPASEATVEFQPDHRFALFGFRSHKDWKMFLSVLYLIYCATTLVVVIASPPTGTMPQRDHTIEWINNILCLLLFVSPYIFLSESPLRNILPFFKARKAGKSFVGMLIVFILIFTAIGLVDDLHTEEYKADQENHAYVLVSVEEPSCEDYGEECLVCEFCGEESCVDLRPLGHDYEKTELEDGTIHYRCTRCGDEYEATP